MSAQGPKRPVGPAIGLVAAVGFIFVVSAFLRTGDPREETRAAPTPTRTPSAARTVQANPFPAVTDPRVAPDPEAAAPEPLVPPSAPGANAVPDEPIGLLAGRALRDVRRLEGRREGWTVQLVVACQASTVERLLSRAGGSSSIYLLPATLGERSCFRVCWGVFATRDDAESEAGIPPGVREGLGPSRVRPIADVLP